MKKEEKNLSQKSDQEEATYDSSTVGDAALLELLNPEHHAEGESTEENETRVKESEPVSENIKTKEEKSDNSEIQQSSEDEDKEDSVKSDDPAHSDNLKDPSSLAQKLLNLAISLLSGEKQSEDILKLLDAARAAEAIEEARREGEIAGRNATIEEKLRTVSPSIPTISGSSPSRMRPKSIFDIAALA